MSSYSLTKTRFRDGYWHGHLIAADPKSPPPQISAFVHENEIDGIRIDPCERPGQYQVEIALPPSALGDGAHALVITEKGTGDVLARHALMIGELPTDDLYAEIALLRAELELLKGAFRAHCRESGEG